MDFYANGAWIGVDTVAPYTVSWSGVGTGTYALTAQATTSLGAQGTSSAVSVVVGQPPPSTVLGLTITPQTVSVGQTATITVTGTNPCGMLWMDFGDGYWWIAPINGLPFTTTHTWATPGTPTVLARGYVDCGGEVTRQVTVTAAPAPEALAPQQSFIDVALPPSAHVEGQTEVRSGACHGLFCGDRTHVEAQLGVSDEHDRRSESAVHGPAPWLEDAAFDPIAEAAPDVVEYAYEAPKSAYDDDASRAAPATLNLTLMGSGSGSVSGGGLTCTGALGQTCSAMFQVGDVVTLSASAGTGDFAGWGGACGGTGACTATLSAATLVVATFNLPPPTVTQFYHLDVLGSVRAVTGADGAVLRRHDYAAFGEELHTEEAEPGLPYVAKQQRFTGKERDGESGLDYFAARYLSAGWGRFTTADPGHVGGDIFDPQSWNAYAYARNNPLRFVDPAGTEYQINWKNDGQWRQSYVSNAAWEDVLTDPGWGFQIQGNNILAFVDGRWKLAGYFYYVGPDQPRTFNAMVQQSGQLADRWLKESLTDMAVGSAFAATGGLASGAFGGGLASTGALGFQASSMTGIANATSRGARMANLVVNLTAREFQANLVKSGYKVVKQGMGTNGPFTVLARGEKTYTIYTGSSTGGATAQVRVAGQTVSKIRLSGF